MIVNKNKRYFCQDVSDFCNIISKTDVKKLAEADDQETVIFHLLYFSEFSFYKPTALVKLTQ